MGNFRFMILDFRFLSCKILHSTKYQIKMVSYKFILIFDLNLQLDNL